MVIIKVANRAHSPAAVLKQNRNWGPSLTAATIFDPESHNLRIPNTAAMKPIVQISLDVTTAKEALETAELAMRSGVDWLEAGTPLIIAEGMHGVRALRERFPKTPIVADLK